MQLSRLSSWSSSLISRPSALLAWSRRYYHHHHYRHHNIVIIIIIPIISFIITTVDLNHHVHLPLLSLSWSSSLVSPSLSYLWFPSIIIIVIYDHHFSIFNLINISYLPMIIISSFLEYFSQFSSINSTFRCIKSLPYRISQTYPGLSISTISTHADPFIPTTRFSHIWFEHWLW